MHNFTSNNFNSDNPYRKQYANLMSTHLNDDNNMKNKSRAPSALINILAPLNKFPRQKMPSNHNLDQYVQVDSYLKGLSNKLKEPSISPVKFNSCLISSRKQTLSVGRQGPKNDNKTGYQAARINLKSPRHNLKLIDSTKSHKINPLNNHSMDYGTNKSALNPNIYLDNEFDKIDYEKFKKIPMSLSTQTQKVIEDYEICGNKFLDNLRILKVLENDIQMMQNYLLGNLKSNAMMNSINNNSEESPVLKPVADSKQSNEYLFDNSNSDDKANLLLELEEMLEETIKQRKVKNKLTRENMEEFMKRIIQYYKTIINDLGNMEQNDLGMMLLTLVKIIAIKFEEMYASFFLHIELEHRHPDKRLTDTIGFYQNKLIEDKLLHQRKEIRYEVEIEELTRQLKKAYEEKTQLEKLIEDNGD